MAEDLVIRISGDIGKFDDALKQVSRKTEELEKTLSQVAKISGVAFAGLTAIIGLNVQQFAKFDNQLRSVKTLLDETSFGAKGLEKGFSDMREEALRLQAQTPSSLESVNKALFDTVSAGIEAGRAVQFVGTASKLAVAGVTDISIATDGLTSATNAYSFSAEQADLVAAKFFTAQKYGKTTIEQLATGFGLVGSSASALGVSFEELLASVAAVTLAGVKTNAAYTGMKAVLAGISKPTEDAKKEAERLGIQFNATALASKGFSKFLSDISSNAKFTQESIIRLFGSTEAQNIMFALTGSSAKSFANILGELGNQQKVASTFTEAFNTQNASLSNQMEIIGKKIEVVSIGIGEKLAPYVATATEALGKLLDIMANNPGLTSFLATTLAVSAAAAGLVTTISLLGIGYLKVTANLVALNTTFGITNTLAAAQAATVRTLNAIWAILTTEITVASVAQRAYAISVAASTVAMNIAAVAARALGIAIKIALGPLGLVLAAATALVIYFQDELISALGMVADWFKKILPEALYLSKALLTSIGAAFVNFGQDVVKVFFGIGEILMGALTLDPGRVANGLAQTGKAIESAMFESGTRAANVFWEAYEQAKADGMARDQETTQEAATVDQEIAKENATKKMQIEIDYNAQLKAEKERVLMDFLAMDADYQKMSAAQKAEFLAINKESLLGNITLEKEVEAQAIAERLKAQQEMHAQMLKDRQKFGEAYAVINKFMQTEQVKGAKNAAAELVQLQQSSNSTLKTIGKAAAVANITIKTAESAMNIYAGFSTIPIVGPALGIAGAAAAVAFGATQVGQVLGAKEGGIMTGGIPGMDSIPTMTAPGELVAPEKNFDEVVNAVADSRIARGEGGQGSGGGVMEVVIGFRDDAFELIDNKLVERRRLGIGSGSLA